MTASVVREQDEWVLEAGVLPLASGGIAIIDEFDKLGDEDRAMMHEALEEGMIHVDKASIHAVLPARCSLLGVTEVNIWRCGEKYQKIANLNENTLKNNQTAGTRMRKILRNKTLMQNVG